jgi:hypothetical protein
LRNASYELSGGFIRKGKDARFPGMEAGNKQGCAGRARLQVWGAITWMFSPCGHGRLHQERLINSDVSNSGGASLKMYRDVCFWAAPDDLRIKHDELLWVIDMDVYYPLPGMAFKSELGGSRMSG